MEGVSDHVAYTWYPFPPTGLPCPALIWGFVPCLIVSCYDMFSGYPWDACPFVKGYGGGVDLGERGDEAGWEEQREGTKK